ncbi:MAG: hypothetical protein J6S89_10065 [Paludibacteraceae bacterium]|nr:hypothetical protein [Paludibacteraceae bacterium]
MNTANRVILNTSILYLKIILSTVISLISVPLVLHALGKSDYGVYTLVAGVIGMLAFLNASLSISTQRFFSVAVGAADKIKLNEIFNVAIVLHLLIGFVLVILFEACYPFLFSGFLKIDVERLFAAKTIYHFLVVSTFFSTLTVPYVAFLNAKENMLVFSLVEIVDALLKLFVALYLASCKMDRLIFYGASVALITIISVIFYALFVRYKYKELDLHPFRIFNKDIFKQMLGFAGWNTYGAVAMIGRNQGNAILINMFFGTIANASYGIANHINGVLSQFSTTIQRALNPQLMQSEGAGKRERLMNISILLSKTTVLLFAFFAVPLLIEMPYVLKLWLKEIPENTIILSRLILILTVVFQYSTGLKSAIQAVGDIKMYFIIIGSLLLMNLPIIYVLYSAGLPIYYCLIVFVTIETISLFIRMYIVKKKVGIKMMTFAKEVIFKTLLCIFVAAIPSVIMKLLMKECFGRLLLVVLSYTVIYALLIWRTSLDDNQKNSIRLFITKFIHRK